MSQQDQSPEHTTNARGRPRRLTYGELLTIEERKTVALTERVAKLASDKDRYLAFIHNNALAPLFVEWTLTSNDIELVRPAMPDMAPLPPCGPWQMWLVENDSWPWQRSERP